MAIIFVGAVTFSSCQKEELETSQVPDVKPDNSNQVTVKNNMLSFDSPEAFENTITFLADDEPNNFDNWQYQASFKSLEDYNTKNNSLENEDEILLKILNEDGCIEINKKVFKLNFDKRQVLVFDDYDSYQKNKYTKVYSFDEDVLEKEFRSNNIETNESKAKGESYYNPNYRKFKMSNLNVNYKIAYYKYGIYFTLVAKIKKSKTQIGGCHLEVGASGYYKPKNRRRQEFKRSAYHKSGFWWKYKVRPYYSTRSLESYYIYADFHTYDDSYSYYDTWSH